MGGRWKGFWLNLPYRILAEARPWWSEVTRVVESEEPDLTPEVEGSLLKVNITRKCRQAWRRLDSLPDNLTKHRLFVKVLFNNYLTRTITVLSCFCLGQSLC